MWIFSRKQRQTLKVGLSLSGGGTRGFAHVGAIKAFEEAGLVFDCVAGTSAGSMVGALYASGMQSEQMLSLTKLINEKEIRNSKLFFVPSDSGNLERLMEKFMGKMEFKDLQIPFSCVAVDMVTGTEVVLNSGAVARAVSASCSVPLFFTPVVEGKKLLVDGGLLNTIPSDVVRDMGAQYVVAVDLNAARGAGTSSTKLPDVLMATWSIAMKSTSLKGTLYSNTIIAPDLTAFKATKLIGVEKMVEEGYRATKQEIPRIITEIQAATDQLNGIKPKQ